MQLSESDFKTQGGNIVAVHLRDQTPGFASYYMLPNNDKMPADIRPRHALRTLLGACVTLAPLSW